MDKRNDEMDFSYSYSAKEQEEIKKIREKYTEQPREESKMERLRRIDREVSVRAEITALSVGIVGALVLGSGMSLIMTELGETLGLSDPVAMVVGVIVGLLGGALIGLAYPVYNFSIRKGRKRASAEVLRLTDELMK